MWDFGIPSRFRVLAGSVDGLGSHALDHGKTGLFKLSDPPTLLFTGKEKEVPPQKEINMLVLKESRMDVT